MTSVNQTNKKPLLQCNCCHLLYDRVISLAHEQAADCSANFIMKNNLPYIYGYYGSSYDDTTFISTGWKPPQECGVICDTCICDLLTKGLIKEVF